MISDLNYEGTASGILVIGKATAVLELGALSQTYDGSPKTATLTTTPSGLATSITYNGSPIAPTVAGSYEVVATIADLNYEGTASSTLVVGKATAVLELGALSQTYDGSPKNVIVTTSPLGLAVSIAYGDLTLAPTEIGYYPVVATVNDANYLGSGTGTLIIAPAKGWVSWRNEHFTAAEQAAGLAAENADPDFDNWRNLAEYALGTDPNQFNPPLLAAKDVNSFSLTFTRPVNLLDVIYGAESSVDLHTWSPVPLEVLQSGSTETVRARVLINSGNPLLRFLRLRFDLH
jgi:hypothetical protein